jgi:carboxypeptidase family protein/TonB-dependent receptor-like protein
MTPVAVRRLVFAVALLTCATSAAAQEFRATVTGKVTDASAGAMPGVTVTITNTDTNETVTAVTNNEGLYTLPFLRPGKYKVAAQLQGFRRFEQLVQLEVGQSQTVNIALQIGALTETVTVVAESTEVTKADRGMVIDNQRITELPLNARNPFMLSYLAPGITYNGPAIYQRPFDNGAIADWSINGGQNRNNEFLLDGAPNNSIQGGNNIAYVPPVDAVQEFKIVTNSYDAQYGRTAGGVINVSLKSGTNKFHGAVYEFARRKAFDSNEYQFKLRGTAKPDHKLDQYGFQIDGPVQIPRAYDGRGKTFFMVNYEGYHEATPNPATYTVPDEAQLRGDFSNLRNAQGQLITIYDPKSGRQEGNNWVRDPFLNNIIPPERIDPMARRFLQYFLRPNTTPTSGDPWRNNYAFAPNLAFDDFHNFATKVDQNLSEKTRMFFRYAYNTRAETRYTNGITTGPAQDGQLPLERKNHTGVADWVRIMSSSLVFNVRAGLNQYLELARSDPGLSFDPAELGFPPSLINQLPNKVFPRIGITDYQGLGRQGRNSETTTVLSVQPNMTWSKGRHSVRGGLDMRLTWYTREINGNLFVMNFDNRFTRRLFNQNETAPSGNSIASFLLGAASGGQIDNNFYPTFRWNYNAPWIQDDWKITNRLTLNLGLRWDLNSPVFEEQNRVNYGFDTTSINPVSSRINPSPAVPWITTVKGGVQFAAVNGNPKYPYQWDKNNIQPRAGVTYMLNERTILRGGYGLYFLNVTGTTTQNGFSISTPLITSNDGDRTSTFPLSNPFSQGVAQAPGAALGLETFLGRSPNFSNIDYLNPYVHQFSIGVQHQLPWRASVDISYVGSRTRQEQNSWGGFNEPPLSLRDQCDVTKGGQASFCNALLPNPFVNVAGFEGTNRYTSPTLSRFELSRPFPQFTGITQFERNDGQIWYDSLQVVLNKRLSDGISLAGNWTLAKMIEENGFKDDLAGILQKSPYTTDRRHRVTISGVYSLPFGRDRKYMRDAGPVVEALAGGWEVAGMWLFNTGRPWDLPGNVFYVKDAKLPQIEYTDTSIRAVRNCVATMSDLGVVTMQAFSVAAGCTEPNFIIRPNFTGRTTEFRDDAIRRTPFYQFDINFAKMVQLSSTFRLQIRFELYNVLNQVIYDERQYVNNPTDALFGSIDRTSVRQSNFPRYGQLGLKLIF